MQGRGLDVLPTTISRFRNGGDATTADLLERVVYPDEITHCAAGVYWFKFLCCRSSGMDEESDASKTEYDMNEQVIHKFHSTVRSYFRGPLKPPFNEYARKAAGFGPQWYLPLALKESTEE